MIGIYLPAFPFRGVKAPYLWFLYKAMTAIKEPLALITTQDYLLPCTKWQEEGRWEVTDDGQKRLGYELPNFSVRQKDNVYIVNEESLSEALTECGDNSNLLFKKFLTEIIPDFKNALIAALQKQNDIECILTICNCPSLNAAAEKYNIPVINLELGPLRSPTYLFTGYFDFSGVNGNTEAEKRYFAAKQQGVVFNKKNRISALRDFFINSRNDDDYIEPEYDVGIVLQVENDSNILAFSNSFDNQALLDYAEGSFIGKKIVRPHPGSHFRLIENPGYEIDNNNLSIIDFLKKCRKILTINSSVGLEAMLMNIPVKILGDCSYAFCNVDDVDERVERLTFYLFSYLVPFDLLFNAEYIRFRLTFPSEHEILSKHILYYLSSREKQSIIDMKTSTTDVVENGMYERGLLKELEELKIKNLELNDIVSRLELELQQEKLLQAENDNNDILVDVIVPVYGGLQETQECIESAISTLPSWAELIVINDASPEPELTDWLRKRAQDNSFKLLENENNLGFVATVNRGMKLHSKRDVLLLNSDVEVANKWLERIYDAAYSRERVGSVTPFSNNATICSFPNFCEDNELFSGMDVQSLDDEFETYGKENNLVEIPTGVGFCMYIRRDCLNQVGYFDEETFGRGYGEENDWCQRAAKAGWPNFHQLNVFVYHKGGVSFAGEQSPRKIRAMELLNELHPNYTRDVMEFISRDPAKQARQRMLLRILAKANLQKILLVSHHMGGGTTYHLEELSNFYKGRACFFILMPNADNSSVVISLSADGRTCKESISVDIENGYDDLLRLLRFLGISHIHFHHLMGIPEKIKKLHLDLKCSYDVTIHDYFAINGNPSPTDKNGLFIGDNTTNMDELCAETYPLPVGMSAATWRSNMNAWLFGAERVIFPSADTKFRFTRYFPDISEKAVIAWHPDYEKNAPYPDVRKTYTGDRKLKVLVLGAISREKGAFMLDEVAHALKRENIEFHLLGYACSTLNDAVICHGAYSNQDLEKKLNDIAPDVMWFPAQWPETYSYTLSAALQYGLPVVVPNIGAFGERLIGRKFSRIINWDISFQRMSELWRQAIADFDGFFQQQNVDPMPDVSSETRVDHFYQDYYIRDSWWRESELGRIDFKTLIDSFYSSENITIAEEKISQPHGRKEKLLAVLWMLRQNPALSWATKLIPYRLQRYVKRQLSRRALHEIVR
ncbi:glycosyltransferase [Klebsiella pneumoniae]|nr:glycosyltransferase [Klebsiella pneumoniae]